MFLAQTECPGVTHERLHFHFLKVLTLENHNIDEDNEVEEDDGGAGQAVHQLDNLTTTGLCSILCLCAGEVGMMRVLSRSSKKSNTRLQRK